MTAERNTAQILALLEGLNKTVQTLGGDLRKEMNTLREEMNTRFDRIERGVKNIERGRTAAKALDSAKNLTVSVVDHRQPAGHGLLVRIPFQQVDTVFLLSAAHVLVPFSQGQKIWLDWKKHGVKFEAIVGNIFLSKEYIQKGTVDVGLMEIKEIKSTNFKTEAVPLQEQSPTGDILVGFNTIRLVKGTCVSVNESSNRRLLIHGMSAGGASGSPLFNNDGTLCAILHGESKHGGGGHDDPSSHVYGDNPFNVALNKIENFSGVHDLLKATECFGPDVMSRSDKEFLLKESANMGQEVNRFVGMLQDHQDLHQDQDHGTLLQERETLDSLLSKFCDSIIVWGDNLQLPEMITCLLPGWVEKQAAADRTGLPPPLAGENGENVEPKSTWRQNGECR